VTAKPISIKGAGSKSGGRVRKAVELISGDLLLRHGIVTKDIVRCSDRTAKSAEGVVVATATKARTIGPER
jgi:hypothetical protein